MSWDIDFYDRYHRNFPLFVREILKADPIYWQQEVAEVVGDEKRIAIKSGHGSGKTAFICWLIIWFLCLYPGARIIATCNTLNQLRTRLWAELFLWVQRSELAGELDWSANILKMRGKNVGDWFAAPIPWNENFSEAFAGLHGKCLILFDEASSIPKSIFEASYGCLTTTDSHMVVCGNPTRTSGEFYDIFSDPLWRCFTVDSRNCDYADQELLSQWIKKYGLDSDFVRVRILGQFPRKGFNNFMGRELLETAAQRPVPIGGSPVAALKLAQSPEDVSALVTRNEHRILSTETWQELDPDRLAAEISDRILKLGIEQLVLDHFAQADDLPDIIKSNTGRVCNINLFNGAEDSYSTFYADQRTELWGRAKRWLKTGRMLSHEGMMGQLITPEKYFTPQNEIVLENALEMRARGVNIPNEAEALAMTFLVENKKRENPFANHHREMRAYV